MQRQNLLVQADSPLHANAPSLILALPTDGVIIDPVLAHLLRQHLSEYRRYKNAVHKGQLHLGSCLSFAVQKQATGLPTSTNHGIAILTLLITHTLHTQSPSPATLSTACLTLLPILQQIKRQQKLSRHAIYLGKSNFITESKWLELMRRLALLQNCGCFELYLGRQADPNLVHCLSGACKSLINDKRWAINRNKKLASESQAGKNTFKNVLSKKSSSFIC